jgi:murein L,D-transpeptidase YcbB/YkuD
LRAAVIVGLNAAEALTALAPATREYAALVEELARVSAEPESAPDRARRIAALRVNLERWRWVPRTAPARRIEVVVPFFELRVRDVDAAGAPHAIIVGAPQTQTPTFVASIAAITLNPIWTPPMSIAMGELAPRFRRNPGVAAQEGFEVLNRAGAVVDPAHVDWRARPFPYTLRQRPGPGNALGRLRFDMPNPYGIFLHDTPSRGLFARAERALSHGCIRVAEPIRLAVDALADPAWDEAALSASIETGETQIVTLAAPLPIFVLYMTAATGEDGAVRFAEDTYGRDARVLSALDQQPPTARTSQGGGVGSCT